MKECPNGHENPVQAKYCRTCGCKFNEDDKTGMKEEVYTPDVFPDIDLIPISTFEKRHGPWFPWLCLVLLLCFIFSDIKRYFHLSYWLGNDWADIVDASALVLFIIIGIITIRHTLQWIRFRVNAAYVESKPIKKCKKRFLRIAKRTKLGLYEISKKRVRLKSEYDDIRTFDDNHFLIKKNGKVGLYSVSLKEIIVPVRYDSIGSFKNYIVDARVGDAIDHYDIKGNLKR